MNFGLKLANTMGKCPLNYVLYINGEVLKIAQYKAGYTNNRAHFNDHYRRAGFAGECAANKDHLHSGVPLCDFIVVTFFVKQFSKVMNGGNVCFRERYFPTLFLTCTLALYGGLKHIMLRE